MLAAVAGPSHAALAFRLRAAAALPGWRAFHVGRPARRAFSARSATSSSGTASSSSRTSEYLVQYALVQAYVQKARAAHHRAQTRRSRSSHPSSRPGIEQIRRSPEAQPPSRKPWLRPPGRPSLLRKLSLRPGHSQLSRPFGAGAGTAREKTGRHDAACAASAEEAGHRRAPEAEGRAARATCQPAPVISPAGKKA